MKECITHHRCDCTQELLDTQASEIERLKAENGKMREALEYYANHESVIKEAYHSNDERQITCVHTFINHRAKECLASLKEGR